MQQISELNKILFKNLDWNKARLTCLLQLVQLVQGLFLIRTVNLAQLAPSFSNTSERGFFISSYPAIFLRLLV